MVHAELVSRYLDRLELERPAGADAGWLRTLHAAHLQRVPFENLDIHLGVPIGLDTAGLADKILVRRRGGFCFELNGLFAVLLEALGFRVSLLGARVWGDDGFGPPLDHLMLGVRCDDDPSDWLADVGFGDHALFPLRVVPRLRQDDPAGVFRVEPAGHGDLDVVRAGRVRYRVESHPRALAEFAPMCWHHEHHPASYFRQGPICTLQTSRGRVTLAGNHLVRTEDGSREETVLSGAGEILAVYRGVFGIVLDRLPDAAAHAA